MPRPPEITERNIALLEAFVLRARRVEEHSLAKDKDQLLKWAQRAFTLTMGGPNPRMRLDLPPEEGIESLAARCRPLLLQGEALHHAKIIKALKFFAPTGSDFLEPLESVRNDWKRLDRNSTEDFGYESSIGREIDDLGTSVSARELAYSWLYGDLVHADALDQARIGQHTLDYRFEAGALLTCQAAAQTIITLNILRTMLNAELLTLNAECFETPVLARGSRDIKVLSAAVAPPGTPMDELYKAATAAAKTIDEATQS